MWIFLVFSFSVSNSNPCTLTNLATQLEEQQTHLCLSLSMWLDDIFLNNVVMGTLRSPFNIRRSKLHILKCHGDIY